MLVVPLGGDEFDEGRFAALLDLAGPVTARRLVLRLDEDLTRISQALVLAAAKADSPAMQGQCHKLIGIAGTVGANRLHEVSVRLHRLTEGQDLGPVAELAEEVQAVLGRLIQRIRLARTQLAAGS